MLCYFQGLALILTELKPVIFCSDVQKKTSDAYSQGEQWLRQTKLNRVGRFATLHFKLKLSNTPFYC